MSDQAPDLARLRTPCVLRSAASSWPAFKLLQPRALSAMGTELAVVAEHSPSRKTKRIQLGDFAAGLAEERYRGWYVTSWTFRDKLPDAAAGIVLPSELRNWLDVLPEHVRPEWLWLFLGGAETSTALHIDVMLTSAWNALMYGVKIWSFLSPALASARRLIPPGLRNVAAEGDAVAFWCIQEPGDIVLTPSGWAHDVRNVTSTVAVTGNYVNESNAELVRQYLKSQSDNELLELLDAAHEHVARLPQREHPASG